MVRKVGWGSLKGAQTKSPLWKDTPPYERDIGFKGVSHEFSLGRLFHSMIGDWGVVFERDAEDE